MLNRSFKLTVLSVPHEGRLLVAREEQRLMPLQWRFFLRKCWRPVGKQKITGTKFHCGHWKQSAYHPPRNATATKMKAAHTISSPTSSSKVAGPSGSTPHPKLKLFAAALAEKGVTVEAALAKVGTGSPSRQQYLADLDGYRVT